MFCVPELLLQMKYKKVLESSTIKTLQTLLWPSVPQAVLPNKQKKKTFYVLFKSIQFLKHTVATLQKVNADSGGSEDGVREHVLVGALLLHRAHFVLWDGQLGEGATVGWRVVRPRRHCTTHRDTGRDGWHFSCLTLSSNSRSFWRLVHVAVWDGAHAGEELD